MNIGISIIFCPQELFSVSKKIFSLCSALGFCNTPIQKKDNIVSMTVQIITTVERVQESQNANSI